MQEYEVAIREILERRISVKSRKPGNGRRDSKKRLQVRENHSGFRRFSGNGTGSP